MGLPEWYCHNLSDFDSQWTQYRFRALSFQWSTACGCGWEHEPTPSHDLTGLPLLSHSPRGQKEGQQASLTPRTGSHHFYRGHPPRPQALWEDQAVLWRWLFLSSLRALKTVTPQNQWAPLILLSLALIVAVVSYFPLSLFKPLWSMCVFVCADMSDSLWPMDCSPPGSSVHGILQARILDGLPCPPPGDLPDPEMEPGSLTLDGRFFNTCGTWEASSHSG